MFSMAFEVLIWYKMHQTSFWQMDDVSALVLHALILGGDALVNRHSCSGIEIHVYSVTCVIIAKKAREVGKL